MRIVNKFYFFLSFRLLSSFMFYRPIYLGVLKLAMFSIKRSITDFLRLPQFLNKKILETKEQINESPALKISFHILGLFSVPWLRKTQPKDP